MARITVKQKLQALQTKHNISEEDAKDLLTELEADYTTSEQKIKLADDWGSWWSNNSAIIKANEDRAALAGKYEQELTRIKRSVGIDPDSNEDGSDGNGNSNNSNSNFDPRQFAQGMFAGTSNLVKDISKISFEHFQKFKEVPDYDAIEEIVNKRGLTAVEAYKVWVEPKAKEAFETSVKEKYEKEFNEKLEQEKSKLNFPSHNQPKTSNTIVRSFLDRKPGTDPTEQEQLDDFVKDLQTPVSKAGTA